MKLLKCVIKNTFCCSGDEGLLDDDSDTLNSLEGL